MRVTLPYSGSLSLTSLPLSLKIITNVEIVSTIVFKSLPLSLMSLLLSVTMLQPSNHAAYSVPIFFVLSGTFGIIY